MVNLSPSKIIVESLRDHADMDLSLPVAGKAEHDTHCAACGVDLPAGSPTAWLKFGDSFTDWQYLANETVRGEAQVCQHCAALFSSAFLQKVQATASAAIYSAEGAFVMNKDSDRVRLLKDPPKTPFVAYIATTMGQHVAWRAPVTLDRDLIRIAVAREVITINRTLLLQAVEVCERVMAAIGQDMQNEQESAQSGKRRGRPKAVEIPKHPFSFLDRDMEDPYHGQIKDHYRKRMLKLGMTAEIELLESLGEGELWGLSVFVKKKTEEDKPSLTTLKEAKAASADKKAAKAAEESV